MFGRVYRKKGRTIQQRFKDVPGVSSGTVRTYTSCGFLDSVNVPLGVQKYTSSLSSLSLKK